jgi:hypothetical protein
MRWVCSILKASAIRLLISDSEVEELALQGLQPSLSASADTSPLLIHSSSLGAHRESEINVDGVSSTYVSVAGQEELPRLSGALFQAVFAKLVVEKAPVDFEDFGSSSAIAGCGCQRFFYQPLFQFGYGTMQTIFKRKRINMIPWWQRL